MLLVNFLQFLFKNFRIDKMKRKLLRNFVLEFTTIANNLSELYF
jgi:hypothetical protein